MPRSEAAYKTIVYQDMFDRVAEIAVVNDGVMSEYDIYDRTGAAIGRFRRNKLLDDNTLTVVAAIAVIDVTECVQEMAEMEIGDIDDQAA